MNKRVGFLRPGVDIVAPVGRVWWLFRMWMLFSMGRWGLAIVRNDGGGKNRARAHR